MSSRALDRAGMTHVAEQLTILAANDIVSSSTPTRKLTCDCRSARRTAVRQRLHGMLAAVFMGWLNLVHAQAPAVAQSKEQLFVAEHRAMGTVFSLSLYTTSPAKAETVEAEVFDEVDRIDELLSNYKPTSELSRINREAASHVVVTDNETMRFLEASQSYSRMSSGAFDITVGPLMRAWGFYEHHGKVPSSAELEHLHAEVGWQKLQLVPTARTVRFLAPGVELDPGGIGKGFAVDAAVALLRADHVRAALLSAGGSTIYALGAPPQEQGWKIVIPGPLPSTEVLSTLVLRDMSLSSADCFQKNFVAEGHLYCHIMDPRTLRPVVGRIQVTVLHPSATASDALSNVLFVDPPARAFEILSQNEPRAQALVVSEGTPTPRCATLHWSAVINQTHCTPTDMGQ